MTHKAFIVADTTLNESGFKGAMVALGAPDWHPEPGISDAEALTEFLGRLCYKSYVPGLNPNVTKVREGNKTYIGNILGQKHGSVLEHAYVTFALLNVSRIFTHELVRHRAGTAFSQESQRFVRLDDFKLYIPDLTESLIELCPDDPTTTGDDLGEPCSREQWVQLRQIEFVELSDRIKKNVQEEISTYIRSIGLDGGAVPFHVKKTITSALRRLLPGGINTNIGITANHRAWRHMIANRTASGAEVEIREVFRDIGHQLFEKYPNIYQDIDFWPDGTIIFANEKV